LIAVDDIDCFVHVRELEFQIIYHDFSILKQKNTEVIKGVMGGVAKGILTKVNKLKNKEA
jgi:hypothetical protein